MRTKVISLDLAQEFLGTGGEKAGSNRGDLEAAQRLLELGIRTQLTDRQQECVRLYYFEGLTLEQVGEQVGIAPSGVWKHLHRARERLRGFLDLSLQVRRRVG